MIVSAKNYQKFKIGLCMSKLQQAIVCAFLRYSVKRRYIRVYDDTIIHETLDKITWFQPSARFFCSSNIKQSSCILPTATVGTIFL